MLGCGLAFAVVGATECVVCYQIRGAAGWQIVRIGELEIGGDFCWLFWAELVTGWQGIDEGMRLRASVDRLLGEVALLLCNL